MLGVHDIIDFKCFINKASDEDNIKEIVNKHLLSLVAFQFISYMVSLGMVQISIEIKFFHALILVILVFLGIIQLIRGYNNTKGLTS
jgi:hypothetical protein